MDSNDVENIIDEFFQGKYKVEKFLLSSSFSEICLIKHVFLDDLQVIKIIKKPLTSSSDLNLILYEARMACQLKHENIIDIYDAGIIPSSGDDKSTDLVYFIMEYVPGGDLKKYMLSFINSNILIPVSWALFLVQHISFGLSYLHLSDMPIVHGDIKPSNILLSFNSQERIVIKLSDFGFSRKISSAPYGPVIGGTKQFMARECFNNEFYPATDVYALGVIFYILLTNHFPYDVDRYTLVEIIEGKPWRNTLIPPSDYNEDVSSDLDNIVMKCLAVNHQDRYLNANELLNAIEIYMDENFQYDKETFIYNNTIKKAFRLALYEDKFDEAIDILKDSNMVNVLEEVMLVGDNQDYASQTIKIENFSQIIKFNTKSD